MKKRFLSIALALCMLLSALPMTVFAVEKVDIFASGDGSADAPYVIQTLDQLEAFRDSVNNGKTYEGTFVKLGADIDMSEKYGEGKLSWAPIGGIDPNSTNFFHGTFDGDGYVIKNMYMYINPNTGYADKSVFGFFSKLRGTVKNLGFVGGALHFYTPFPDNSRVEFHVGVVAGVNFGTIESCYNESCNLKFDRITRSSALGGICGINDIKGKIINCYNSAKIECSDGGGLDIGGICGNCKNYSRDELSETNIDGYYLIENCYDIGSIVLNNTSYRVFAGGICGYFDNSDVDVNDPAVFKNCYTLNSKPIFSNMSIGVAENVVTITDAQLKQQATFVGFDFDGDDAVWKMTALCPILKNAPKAGMTEDNPIIIKTLDQLEAFRDSVNNGKTYEGTFVKLGADIDMSPKYGEGKLSWAPIGGIYPDSTNFFHGTFDGDGYVIKNMYINLPKFANLRLGFFSNLYGTVKSLGFVGGTGFESRPDNPAITDTSGNRFGAVAGVNCGTIESCYNESLSLKISSCGSDAKYGGICGSNYTNGKIINCYNSAKMDFTDNNSAPNAGGICGDNESVIENCYDIGSFYFNGLYLFGGICALNKTVIKNCYTLNSKPIFSNGSIGVAENVVTITDAQLKQQATFVGFDFDGDDAVWKMTALCPILKKVYKVTFKVDGENDQARYANKGGTVSIDTPTAPTGHSFGGWYTAATGGTKFDLNTAITADTTLYARFTPNTYTVSYNAGANGTGTVTAGSKTHGVDFTLSNNTFTRTGYTQTGWATSDGGAKVYDLGGKYTADADVTLYPVWKVNQYTITVKPENGNNDITIKQDYGTTVTAPTLTRDGYAFDGWDKTFPTTMPAEDMTITAKWKDITAPTGEIKLGTNSWKAFLNNITFGLFFKDTEEVTITANDNSGEAVKIEYLLSDKELTAEELATATFTAYSDKFNVEPNNEYVIYAKLTDKTGNVTYINSNGIVLDNIVPVISGIVNGNTYCEAQTVTVSDKYEITVTVNGTPVTLDANGQFTLSPTSGTQTVVATDKAGNVSAEMIVTVNDGHETDTPATCIKKAVCKHCGVEYGEVDNSNHDLENIKGSAATVTETGNTEYWHCKDCDNNFSDEDGKNAIDLKDTVIGKLPPEIIDGKGQSLTEGEKRELSFRSNAAYSDFVRVELDGKTVDEKNYTVKEGSTIVTLKADYVATLSVGEHTLGIVSQSGTATTTFTVNAKAVDADSPQTGDNSHMALWFALLFVSGGALVGTTIYGKKKKYSAK